MIMQTLIQTLLYTYFFRAYNFAGSGFSVARGTTWNIGVPGTYNYLFIFEPRHEKTSLLGLRPGKTQTGLLYSRS